MQMELVIQCTVTTSLEKNLAVYLWISAFINTRLYK